MTDETVTVVPYYDELKDPAVLAHLVAMIDWHRRREQARGPQSDLWREWYADKILEELAAIRDRLTVLRRSRDFGPFVVDPRHDAPRAIFDVSLQAIARGAIEHADRVADSLEVQMIDAATTAMVASERLGLAPAPDPTLPNPMVAGERVPWKDRVLIQGGPQRSNGGLDRAKWIVEPEKTNPKPRKGIMRLFRRATPLLAVGIFAATLIGLTGVAHATPTPQTKTVSWVTSLTPGVTTPTGAGDVTWPQTLLKGDPACGTVIQTDVYRYGTPHDQAIVDGLLAHGTLNKPGSATWTDSAVVLSWKFTVEETPCPSPTPTPSQTPTPSPSPSPSSTPSETTNPPTPTTPPVVVVTPSPTPSATPPAVLASATLSPTAGPSTPPAKTLPFTGFSPWPYVLGGLACLGLGGLFLAFARRTEN